MYDVNTYYGGKTARRFVGPCVQETRWGEEKGRLACFAKNKQFQNGCKGEEVVTQEPTQTANNDTAASVESREGSVK